MTDPGLFDGCFGHQASATWGGDNSQLAPAHFSWLRDRYGEYSTFYTDMHLELAIGAPGMKIAWLIEPPSLSDTHYRKAEAMKDVFDYILTFDQKLVDSGEPYLYYPLGGSWIKPSSWGLVPKTRMVSMIVSEKVRACGHKVRHEIVRRFPGRFDVWGRGYRPIGSKTHGLYDYRYSIVVESIRQEAYFSEKLIDCLTLGTVPIYWGSRAVEDLFDMQGIIPFEDFATLEQILEKVVSRKDYEKRIPALERNLELAKQYVCAEDWIYRNYPFLFDGGKSG